MHLAAETSTPQSHNAEFFFSSQSRMSFLTHTLFETGINAGTIKDHAGQGIRSGLNCALQLHYFLTNKEKKVIRIFSYSRQERNRQKTILFKFKITSTQADSAYENTETDPPAQVNFLTGQFFQLILNQLHCSQSLSTVSYPFFPTLKS